MTFSKQIEKNNAKVRARRNMENPLGDYYRRDQLQRRIDIGQRLFAIAAGLGIVAIVAILVHGNAGDLAAIVGVGK